MYTEMIRSECSKLKGKVMIMLWYHDECLSYILVDQISLAGHHTTKHLQVKLIENKFIVVFHS